MNTSKLILLISCFSCLISVTQQQQQWLPIRLQFQFLQNYPASKLTEVNTLIQIAQQFYQSSLLVQRQTSPLRFMDSQQSDCSGYAVSDAISQKAFSADLVFLVVLDDSKGDVLAFSGPCAFTQTSQPVFSILGFGKKVTSQKNIGRIQFVDNIATTIHEFMHGLGFIDDLFNSYMDSYTQQVHGSTTFTQNGVLYLATPRILQYTRLYFGCPNAVGNPMEDQGSVGSKNTHWERRLFFNDILIAQDQVGDFIFSIFNYKLLEDSGWYKLGDISVDPMTFGKNRGCPFLYQGCLAGTFPEYCDSKQDGQDFQCNWSQTGIGACRVDDFSNTCQMIQIYGNEDCRNPLDLLTAGTLLKQDYNTLQAFDYNSKCFNGSFTNSSQPNVFTQSCHKFQCTGLASISITIGQNTIQCTSDSQQLTLPSLSGMIQCPSSIMQFCYEYAECLNQCNERGFCVNKKCFCIKGYSGLGCEQTCNSYRYNGQCVTTCPAKTFSDLNTLSCLGCPFNCAACTLIGSCDTCKAGYILHHGSCENSYQFQTLIAQNYVEQSSDRVIAFQSVQNTSWILKTFLLIQVLMILI